MGYQSEEALTKAYALLEAGDPAQARNVLAEAIQYDLENKEASFALWCCTFWDRFVGSLKAMDAFERGEELVTHWKVFLRDIALRDDTTEKAVYATQRGVFSLALASYAAADKQDAQQQAETFRKTGLCHKKLGNYADAFSCLTEANRRMPLSAPIIAEMADCYALCGEEKKARVLFREAFFQDAQAVDLDFLDSELICCLIRQVRGKGYTGAALQEWIPVYGTVYGVFSAKRKLKGQEVGILKRNIYAMESERCDPSSDLAVLTPKLINMYFWLIDHYVHTEDNRDKTSEILLKIKMIDRNIYSLYDAK